VAAPGPSPGGVLARQEQTRQLQAELARLRTRQAGPENLQLLLTVSCSASYIKTVSVIDLATLTKVPGRVIGMTVSTREADAAFADVVYADQQWVDAEFDALISAAFSEPPAPPPPAPPRVPPRPGTPFPPSRPPAPGPAAMTLPAIGPDHGRQRSPPARSPGWPPGRRPRS